MRWRQEDHRARADMERYAVDQQAGVRDPLASVDAVFAARRRPMCERLELALSWNALAAELQAGLLVASARSNHEPARGARGGALS
jgi:hypothetical protein